MLRRNSSLIISLLHRRVGAAWPLYSPNGQTSKTNAANDSSGSTKEIIHQSGRCLPLSTIIASDARRAVVVMERRSSGIAGDCIRVSSHHGLPSHFQASYRSGSAGDAAQQEGHEHGNEGNMKESTMVNLVVGNCRKFEIPSFELLRQQQADNAAPSSRLLPTPPLQQQQMLARNKANRHRRRPRSTGTLISPLSPSLGPKTAASLVSSMPCPTGIPTLQATERGRPRRTKTRTLRCMIRK